MRDYTPDEIIQAIEINHNDFHSFVEKKGSATLHIEKDVRWIINNRYAWPNYIFDTQFDRINIETRIKSVLEKIKKEKAPHEWIISPKSKPDDLGSNLAKLGFKKHDTWAAMALDLKGINEEELLAENREKGIVINAIDKKEDLIPWCDILSKESFHGKKLDTKLFEELINDEKVKIYLATIDGEAAGTSMAFFSKDAVGIYMVATSSGYRRRGVGKAAMVTPLVDAKKRGFDMAILQATEMGKKLYAKMGFKEYASFYGYQI